MIKAVIKRQRLVFGHIFLENETMQNGVILNLQKNLITAYSASSILCYAYASHLFSIPSTKLKLN